MTIAMRGGGSNQPQQPPVQQNQQQVGLNTNPKNGGENQKEFQLPDFPPVPHQAASTGVPLNNEAFNQIDKNTESESLNNENNVEKEMMNDEMMLEVREPDFPHPELAKLDEMINRPRWVVPVLPKGELEILLDASIEMCKNNIDTRSEACQRFFREGLTISFSKILTDEAVSGWKFEIHRCIMKNCEKLIELCVYKLSQDWFPLLDLLAMVLNPINKFHTFNGTRTSETAPLGSQVIDDEIYARSSDARTPQGWLVDLINRFGSLGGFQILLERFQNGPSLSVSVIAALIRPFGLCYEFLTIQTIEKFFMSIVEVVPAFLDNLTDEELKKEAKNEAKNDALSAIIKALKCLASRVPNQEETVKNLEMFRLKMILRLLQISSFNGKMNALNEVNKVITSVTYYPHRNTSLDEEVWLTAERMAKWIEENKVLQIVLRDSLHQPQYVEKLEKIIRFVIKEKSLTLDDLDNIWAVQVGKHEAIVKNVHDLLAKLAWDFSPEQLDHLFGRFQESWAGASQKQREKLLELIRRLAEDDKDGVMAHKVLNLLWNLAHSDDVPTEIVDQALSAHVKILDYSCSQAASSVLQAKDIIQMVIDEVEGTNQLVESFKLQCGREYGFSEVKLRATDLSLLSEKDLEGLPTNNLVAERDFSRFDREARVAKSRNRRFKAKNIQNNMVLYKCSKEIKIDKLSRTLAAILSCREAQWDVLQHEKLKTRLEAKLNKSKKSEDYTKKLLQNLKYPFKEKSDQNVQIVKTELAYYAHTHKADKIANPELFRLNGISHEEKLTNFAVLLSNYCISSCTVADLPTNEDNCDASYEWYFGYVKSVINNGYIVDHLHRVVPGCHIKWKYPSTEDVQTAELEQIDRDTQKTHWLERCIDELKNDKWVIPALKQIREICMLYTEAPPNYNHASRSPHMFYRHEVINRLQQSHSLVIQVADNLTTYITKVRQLIKENPDTDPNAVLSNSRYGHTQHVQERLNFLRFLLKDGQLWLCSPQARQIWNCLAENAVFVSDREACFKWFSKLMGEEPDLDPEINKDFFENNLLQLDPCLLTENGMKCFDRFFKAVNSKERKLIPKRRGFLMDDLELIGLDYLWRVVLSSGEEIANKAIELLKETYTNLGPKLTENQVVIHEDFIQSCMDRLKAAYDTISVLERDKASVNRMRQETTRMVRVLKVLYEYVNECDADCTDDRSMLPMARAHRGKHVTLTVRFSNQGRQVDDLEIWSHTNDTLGLVRRQVLNRVVKSSNITANVKIELYLNTELIDSSEDKKVISQIPLRDKTLLTGKVVQVGNNMPSSPDSSTDSSSGTPQHQYDTHTMECETPGVLMSLQPNYVQFLFQLADLGSSLQLASLRDAARALLKLMPADRDTVDKLRSLCMDQAKSQDQSVNPALQNVFFGSSPSQILYNLEVVYALLMPALNPMSEEALDFQYNFIKSGGVRCVLEMLTKNNFLPNADVATKRSAYYMVLKISKFLLTTVAHATVIVVAEACSQPESTTLRPVSPAQHSHAVVLQQALHHIPNASAECMIRNVSVRLAQSLSNQAISDVPDMSTIRAIIKLAWASSSAAMLMIHSSNEELHQLHVMSTTKLPDSEDVQVCKEGLEVLSIALALYPQALEVLIKDTTWHNFIIDLLLLCKIRNVRQSAAEQFVLIATKCSNGHQPLVFFITLLFTVLETTVNEHSRSCHEYFQLLCRLLSYASISDCQLPNAENLLHSEIRWLKQVRSEVLSNSQFLIEESLLEGHLGITRELLGYLGPDVKYEELVEDFLFPASKVVLQLRKNKEIPSTEQAIPVCSSAVTTNAAFDLLVALCTGCVPNLQLVTSMLTDMYYSEKDQPITEWEYLPPVGPRPSKGFVGLKNAGATCYMNSVLQQLYMIESIRTGILSTEGAAVDPDEDFSDEDKPEVESNVEGNEEAFGEDKEENRKEYNLGVMKQVQAIFGHLACSKLQYYVPRGFWKHFKLWGEPVNLREQHDALEFFNSLVDSLDEALKSLGQPTILSKILGGSFADQKICKDCPHRYSREESFTTLNIDIRNHSNLSDSLEQYVKGDLLEGANAYHCDKCNKKVDTVKRLCLKKLPPILTIQLKRFDYDWERECAIKFNDYFEFPRDLDMKPYTASGVAEIEGEVIEHDLDDGSEMETASTKYKLTGIVVHSGQASGGHYYSYIQHRHSDGSLKWYKFDDGEVSECKMDDDEEMKNQCFGGDYMGEVFDHMLKRMSYRRQKRWWNAYILVYRRNDNVDDDASRSMVTKLARTHFIVRKQNVQYMHNKNQFSPEYFLFMKKLISCNAAYITVQPTHDRLSQEGEQLAMMSIQLASNFLFKTAFHTKKSLRGASNEWYDAICIHLRHSRMVRSWFAHNVLFMHSYRFGEYLLECPSSEVRTTFAKIIVFLAHFSLQDGPCPPPMIFGGGLSQLLDSNATLSDHILQAVLLLLKKEVSEHGRHLTQYFSLFMMYCSLGVPERRQLLQLNVVSTFINVALDDGPGPAIKYQYAELSKLYQVISILVRCCDISSKAQSSITVNQSSMCLQNNLPLPNPHAGDHICPEYIVPVQPYVAEILLNKNNFLKKVIEDAAQLDETPKLLKFCCWENPSVSHFVLMELLWQIAYSYTYELKPYFDLLLHILLVEDSWQSHRIPIALKGVEDREGMFDTIKRNMTHHQKRAYQCIKFMVNLFNICQCAANMLQSNGELKRKWISAVNWLNKELEKHKPYPSNSQYPYNSWSPPAQSNETANGFFLERSHSARVTLAKAFELCPDEDNDEPELSEEGGPDSPINDDNKAPPYVQSINSQQQSACDHQQSSPGGNNSPGPSHPTLTQRLQQSPQLYMSPTHVPTPSNTRVQVVSGMMTIPANSHQKHSEDSSGSITTTTNPTNTTNSTTTTNAVVEDQ
ncbi:putative ubiquitin carboxyl-terminal hydrolase FAF-X [Nymphon striatum]|nr:putative ubiquitin carboxyl-terminal hydrolase FAF-X [Nymphon striatum]